MRRTAALARDAARLRAGALDEALLLDADSPGEAQGTHADPEEENLDDLLSSPAFSSPAASYDPGAARAEFRELVESAGGAIVGEMAQRRPRPDPATLLGHGKVEELAGAAAAAQADLILFDHDLSPTQLRNLEAALPCPVVDRTQLILDIFARHAPHPGRPAAGRARAA